MVGRFARALLFQLKYESGGGRAAEVAAWSNALAALLVAGLGIWYGWPVVIAALTALLTFALFRVCLVSRRTIWIPAVLSTLVVGGVMGAFAWVFGHLTEQAWAPVVGALVAACLGAAGPIWAYATLLSRREVTPDSLLEPQIESIPSSRF